MLTKAHIKEYIDDKCRTMRRQLKEFKHTGEARALHKLRVAVKKLRALEYLLRTQTEQQEAGAWEKRPTRSLKRLFKHAGIIRTAQLHLDLLKDLHVPAGSLQVFVSEQQQIITEETTSFHDAHPDYKQRIRKARRRLKKRACDISSKDLQSFFKFRLQDLRSFFSTSGLKEEALHDKRKDLKNLVYLHEMLPESLRKTVDMNERYAHQLQEGIGQWHDHVDAITLLDDNKAPGTALTKVQKQKKASLTKVEQLTKNFTTRVED